MPDRSTLVRSALAIAGVSLLALLFIASYGEALHDPTPHDVPIAATEQVPAPLRAKLDASAAIAVHSAASPADAMERIDRRESYGALLARPRGLTLVVAPAASAAVAQFLGEELAAELRAGGTPVTVRTVHPLPRSDSRGLVGFYTAVGWAIAGYLGATLFGLTFGTSPDRRRTSWRLGALSILGLIVGFGGAAVSTAIAGYDRGFFEIGLIGLLTVMATGSVTVALQALFGILGTGIAILLFVVFGNPAAGGAYATELLPGLWRAAGQLIPTGAATTGVRDAAYFPAATIGGPLVVLAIWILASAAIALLVGKRARAIGEEQERGSLAGVG
jgi:hypothetical protein